MRTKSAKKLLANPFDDIEIKPGDPDVERIIE